MYLARLTDEELCNYADQKAHDLTTSDLERELLKRLEARLAEDAALALKIQLADKFYDIASDAGDVIERLAGLVKETV